MVKSMNGHTQGYFIGLFFRFLWYLFICTIFQTMILYIFGYNVFTYYIMAIIFSFLINTSLPIKDNYPFLRHGLILFSILFVQSYISPEVYRLYEFFKPDLIWSIMMLSSFVFGIIYSIGRYGNGSMKATIESVCGLVLLVLIILAFVFYWWQGGLIYLLLRLPLLPLELLVANSILAIATRKYERNEDVNLN